MADWRSELEELLNSLNVTPPTEIESSGPDHALAGMSPSISVPGRELALSPEEQPRDGDEVRAVRSEIESTIRKVHLMAQAGLIDHAVRDDVVFVLLALTRPRPGDLSPLSRRQTEASQDWQITSAAAALRFCRIVQLLLDHLNRDE
jgi:hypothetical protein